MGIYLNGRNFVPMGYINRISANTDEVSASVENLIREAHDISTIISNDLSVVLHTLSSGDNEFTGTNSFRKIEVSSVSVSSMNAERIESLDEGQQYKLFIKSGENLYQIPYDTFIGQVSSMILPSIMSSLTGNTIVTFSDGDVQQYMWMGIISPETMIQENLKNPDGTWDSSPVTVKLGTNVNNISSETFSNCGTLEKVKIPGSVETIGTSAFYNCSSLADVDYREKESNEVSNMTDYPWGLGKCRENGQERQFRVVLSCYDKEIILDVVAIPTRVYWTEDTYQEFQIVGELNPNSIQNLTSAIKVQTGTEVTSIGDYAFDYNYVLESVSAQNVLEIGTNAFNSCTSLMSVDMPKVQSIGTNAFFTCGSLSSVEMQNVSSVGIYAFDHCTSLSSVDIPNVKNIGDYAFYVCGGLSSVNISNALSVGSNAFEYCTSLTSIYMPNVQSLGAYAFNRCEAIKTVTIANLASVHANTFQFTGNDLTVQFTNQSKNTISSWFNNGYFGTNWGPVTVICNNGWIYAYYGSDWEFYGDASTRFGVRNSSDRFFEINGTLDKNSIPASPSFFDQVSSVYTGSTVTDIGKNTFYNLSGNTSFHYATMPNVLNVLDYAFCFCRNLQSVDMPNVISVGYGAFEDCDNLSSIDMPNVLSVGEDVFYDCNNLTSVYMPNVNTIGYTAFLKCTKLTSIDMPNVSSIMNGAFLCCINLINITIGSDIQSVGEQAFDTHGPAVDLSIGKDYSTVVGMGYGNWCLPTGSTIHCSDGQTITIQS